MQEGRYGIALETRRNTHRIPMVSGIDIDEWAIPAPPKRKCQFCITLLRTTNRNDYCDSCARKLEAMDFERRELYFRNR